MLGRGSLIAVLVAVSPAAGVAHANAAVSPPPARETTLEAGTARFAMVEIPPGTFEMGTDQVIHADDHWVPCDSCAPRNDAERPAHRVTLTRGFWIGRFPVTQEQWRQVVGNNPSKNRTAGADAPVEQVSWNDVQAFLAKLNAAQTQWSVRLPTEAEWEYSARAGSDAQTYGPLDSIAWYGGNSGGTTHPVGGKRANAFGLYDMLGNVWEWCGDWYAPYSDSARVDPTGAPSGDRRLTRGGCYYCASVHERAARRNRDLVDHSSPSIGFRIAASPRNNP